QNGKYAKDVDAKSLEIYFPYVCLASFIKSSRRSILHKQEILSHRMLFNRQEARYPLRQWSFSLEKRRVCSPNGHNANADAFSVCKCMSVRERESMESVYLVNNPLASQAAAAAAAMGSIASSQAFGNALSSLQGVTGQLVTNAQGQLYLLSIVYDPSLSTNREKSSQIIGTIPLMPNPGPSSQAASGTQGLQVQPITPQLLTNAQGQIIATVIGNQILPVINTQGITLSPIKPGQQSLQPSKKDPQTYSDMQPLHGECHDKKKNKRNMILLSKK
ncbi:hypothetical protein STEG23_008667, partial [Scotinomys teguina]